jgi:hypothetical protein
MRYTTNNQLIQKHNKKGKIENSKTKTRQHNAKREGKKRAMDRNLRELCADF